MRRVGWAHRVWISVLVVGWAGFVAHVGLGVWGRGADDFFNEVVYNALLLGAAVALLWRGFVRRAERPPWLAIGVGVLLWGIGELYYTLVLAGLRNPPSPSPADAFYLAFFPAAYVGLGLLIRSRAREHSSALWLDGAVGALGLMALASALFVGPILENTTGSLATVATNLAYPLGDMLLLGFAILAVALTGWRPGWVWVLIAVSFAVNALADTVYLFQVATNSYVEGGWLDALWPTAALMLVFAAWAPVQRVPKVRLEGWRTLLVPGAALLIAVGLLLYDRDSAHRLAVPSLVLATATLLVAMLRMALTFRDNARLLTASRTEAMTDGLTGLANRRRLVEDLDDELALATEVDPRVLVLYDLNGFKHYNDNFGHPAGDALLARLGRKFAAGAQPYGTAYRMGGDEFCALVRPGATPIEMIVDATVAAFAEQGEGFDISTSYGAVSLPTEAREASHALHIADQRLYLNKDARPSSAKHQLRDVLMQVLHERQPELHEHLRGVAALAIEVGRGLGMGAEDIDVLARAAELHDVGKMAIPDAILNKPGPLTADEWDFMRRHTILGERILGAAPALGPVASLVRSTHERWDGHGYPDSLRGDDIPLGARIVLVCDAYDAITSERPYREARSRPEALQELRANAGSQFDPRCVAALHRVLGKAPTSLPAPTP
jgi:two-component system, cell cycle response regulator